MRAFQINALVRLLTYSACFEPHGFIIRRRFVRASFVWNTLFHLLDSLHKCMKNITIQKLTYLLACFITYLLTYLLTHSLTHSMQQSPS